MPVSIKDVARIAGVSPGTVSRALRDSPRVHPKTKERIHTIAEEMGYVPNTIARSLVTGQTYTVGLVVTTMTDPFLGSLAQTVEFTANGHGYTVILTSSNNQPEREIAAAEMFQTRRVDGVIVTSSRIGALYQKRLERLRVPVVLINSLAEYKSHNIYSIGVDNHHGGYLATQHLLQKGHQRIAYVASPPGRSDDEQRMAGYRDALDEAGIALDPSLVVRGTGRAGGGERALPVLLSLNEPPSAVFCYNDMTAIGLVHAAREAGLSLPEELAVVGFDDIAFAQFAYPSLTTLAQPVTALGEGAVEMVLALLADDGADGGFVANRLVRGRLVVRASSG
ncbi:MAG: LacI family DNA-binding transcriptional regulator [Anaerolineae bacterium]